MKTRNLSTIIAILFAVLILLAGISTASEQNRNRDKHCNGQYPCGDPTVPDVPDPQDPTDPTDPINPGDNPTINNMVRQFSGGNHIIFMLGIRAGAEQWRIDNGYVDTKLVSFGIYNEHPIFILGFDLSYDKSQNTLTE